MFCRKDPAARECRTVHRSAIGLLDASLQRCDGRGSGRASGVVCRCGAVEGRRTLFVQGQALGDSSFSEGGRLSLEAPSLPPSLSPSPSPSHARSEVPAAAGHGALRVLERRHPPGAVELDSSPTLKKA